MTFVAYGLGIHVCLRVAKILKYFYNLNVEVIDLRTIRPLDEITILKSVKKTRRIIVVEENKPFCCVASQIVHLVQEKLFYYLEKPILKICNLDAPNIYSMPLEKYQVLNLKRVLKCSLKSILI
jgi:pyruvate dehydrogenase E1 component beta subunit